MQSYTISIDSPSLTNKGGFPSLVLRDLTNGLTESSIRAVRLRVDGRSTARGHLPTWIDRVVNYEVRVPNANTLEITAPSLSEAVPEKFQQQQLFNDLDVSKSAIAFFEDGFQDALTRESESDLYDNGLLDSFLFFSRLFGRGVQRLRFFNGKAKSPFSISDREISEIKELQRCIPKSRRIRVAGRLDTIRHSDRMFVLVLRSGERIRGVADVDSDELKDCFGRHVIVEGAAVYRPSSSLQRIEADFIQVSDGDDAIWSTVPKPLDMVGGPNTLGRLKQLQTPTSGIGAMWGKWPGNESEDEIFRALEELS